MPLSVDFWYPKECKGIPTVSGMRRNLILICFISLSAVILYEATAASAKDLIVGKPQAEPVLPGQGANTKQQEKSLSKGRELFNRREGNNANPLIIGNQGGLKKTTNIQAGWKMPASWGLLDETSRNIKKAETESVMKEQRDLESKINQDNAKSYALGREKAAKQRAEEKATENANPKAQTTKEAATKAINDKKDQVLKKKTVIKREKDPNKGKPRKLFNSPSD